MMIHIEMFLISKVELGSVVIPEINAIIGNDRSQAIGYQEYE